MICSLCFKPCDDGDSIGSHQGLCQDCWESACSAEWWEAIATMQELFPVEAANVEPVECTASNP